MAKQNVIIFFTDDERFDTIAALGNKEISTPNIDKLVEEGTSFCRAHIPGGTVGAVCMPSRAMINTGRTLFHLKNSGSEIPDEHALMGETFKNAGYECFGIGKWHNGKKAYSRSFTGGGEIFFGGMNDHWNVPVFHYDPEGKYDQKLRETNNWYTSNKVSIRHGDHVHAGKHSSELFADCAIDCIKNRDTSKPFYMYLAFMAPHDPRTMPDEFRDMYDPDKITLPENYMEQHPFLYGVEEIRDEILAAYPRNEKEIRRHIAEYYGMISHLDHELGRVVEQLKAQGDYENTTIVFAGDNGLALGQHGLMGKQSCYEHSVRVPLIFKGAGIPKNKKCQSYAYLLDVFPTLCDLMDFEIPDSVEGKSLVPAIKEDKVIRDELYLAYGKLVRAVKNERYKLIEYRNEGVRQSQLFDLENDPHELNNLIDDPSKKEIIDELRARLLKLADEWGDKDNEIGKDFWKLF